MPTIISAGSSPSVRNSDPHLGVRLSFYAKGITLKDWAIAHGFNPSLVYAIFQGKRKCLRGESHRIAVALGIKPNA